MLIHPGALWLLVVVPVVAWPRARGMSRRGGRAAALLRGCAVALLVLALARPVEVRPGTGRPPALVLLADGSTSIGPEESVRACGIVADAVSLSRAKGADAHAFVFARRVQGGVETPAAWDAVTGQDAWKRARNDTDLGRALDAALEAVPGSQAAVVLLSDGLATTGALEPALDRMRRARVPVFAIPLAARPFAGVAVTRLDAPERALAGDVVELVATVRSAHAGTATLTIQREREVLHREPLKLVAGEVVVRARSPERAAGLVRYRAVVEAVVSGADPVEDDERLAVVEVRAAPKVLVVAGGTPAGNPLVRALESQKISVDAVAPGSAPRELAGYATVVIDNAPASALPAGFAGAVERHVRERGAGLLMVGGPSSFRSGGYRGTPIEKALPVEMLSGGPARSSATVVLLDRSWSMAGWPLAEGRRACKELLRMLTDRHVAVVAFSAEPREVVELQAMGTEFAALDRAIDAVRPRGGTEPLAALQVCEKILDDSEAEYRNAILLTDGEPEVRAGLVEQAARLRSRGIRLSTVRISKLPETDLLARMAHAGGGSYHQAKDFAELRRLFEREAMVIVDGVADAFGDFEVEPARRGAMVRGFEAGDFPPVGGTAMTRVKTRAELILTAVAEGDRQPLLAVWRYGLGACAAFTSDDGATWAAGWTAWPEFPRFWAQVVKGTLPREASAHALRIQARGGGGEITVDAIDSVGGYVNFQSLIARVRGPGGAVDTALVQREAGRYAGTFDASARGFYEVEVGRRGAGVVARGGLAVCDAGDLEPPGESALAHITASTGGRIIRPDEIGAVLAAVPVARPMERSEAWPGLVLTALLFFLVEVGLRRAGVFRADDQRVVDAAREAAERTFARARTLEQSGDRAASAEYLRAYRALLEAGATERAGQAWERYRRSEEGSGR